jgi:hypothetical protein
LSPPKLAKYFIDSTTARLKCFSHFFVLLNCKTNVCKRTSLSNYLSPPENAKLQKSSRPTNFSIEPSWTKIVSPEKVLVSQTTRLCRKSLYFRKLSTKNVNLEPAKNCQRRQLGVGVNGRNYIQLGIAGCFPVELHRRCCGLRTLLSAPKPQLTYSFC